MHSRERYVVHRHGRRRPAIHVFRGEVKTWMARPSPAMTLENRQFPTATLTGQPWVIPEDVDFAPPVRHQADHEFDGQPCPADDWLPSEHVGDERNAGMLRPGLLVAPLSDAYICGHLGAQWTRAILAVCHTFSLSTSR